MRHGSDTHRETVGRALALTLLSALALGTAPFPAFAATGDEPIAVAHEGANEGYVVVAEDPTPHLDEEAAIQEVVEADEPADDVDAIGEVAEDEGDEVAGAEYAEPIEEAGDPALTTQATMNVWTIDWELSSSGQLTIKGGTRHWEEESAGYSHIDWGTLDKSKVTSVRLSTKVVAPKDLAMLFAGFTNLRSCDLTKLDTTNLASMSQMFEGCSSLLAVDLSSWNTPALTSMLSAFADCTSLRTVNLQGLSNARVEQMSDLFWNCPSLTSVNFPSWDTSNLRDATALFHGCSALRTLDLSGWDVSNVRDLGSMFSGCSALETLDLSGWVTSSATMMASMFSGCHSLTTLDLSSFDTSQTSSMSYLFEQCSSLETLDLSSWNTSAVVFATGMFSGCASLTSIKVGSAYQIKGPDMFPDATDTSGAWWSLRDTVAYTKSQIVDERSGIADTYTASSVPKKTDVSRCTITFEKTAYVYDGTPLFPAPTVTLGNTTLRYDVDYTLTYNTNLSVGTATVSVTGIGSYKGSKVATFEIVAASIGKDAIVEVGRVNYRGVALTPQPKVMVGERTLVKDVDYTLSYRNNLNVGTGTVTVTGRGNYTGSVSAPFEIVATPDLSRDGWIDLADGHKGYATKGVLHTGWLDLNGRKYYFDDSTAFMLRGWQDLLVNGTRMHYYFNPASGNMARGTWMEIEGRKYYFRASGNMATGFADIDDNGVTKKYYFDEQGQMLTGWQDVKVGDKLMHYYFRPSGSLAVGWATIDGKNYYFRESGNLATGFADVDDNGVTKKYYFDEQGQMLTGWQTIGSKTYYFRASGAMQTGRATIDGTTYTFTDQGVLVS